VARVKITTVRKREWSYAKWKHAVVAVAADAAVAVVADMLLSLDIDIAKVSTNVSVTANSEERLDGFCSTSVFT